MSATSSAIAQSPNYGIHRPILQTQYTEPQRGQKLYRPRGAAKRLLECRAPVVLMDGPAGTGKSRALLEKLFLFMSVYPGCRCLLLRKTRASLTQTALVTWETKVLPTGWEDWLHFHTTDQEYRHPNGSILAVAGLDNPAKIMSSEWDVIAVPEATELTQEEFEYLTTRNRNFGAGMEYQQIIMDCNPQGPLHWLNVMCDTPVNPDVPHGPKLITRLKSKHKDNPEYWDEALQNWTARGRAYLTALKKLTGVRFYRLFKGIWRAAEGMVFEEWNPDIHLQYRRTIPDTWPRYWVVDFGYNHPFVWQEWAMDEDGRLWMLHEIHMSHRLVADHCKDILNITGNIRIRPRAVVCDHDAEGRATMERELGVKTVGAYKNNQLENIEAVRRRLRSEGDGLPRLFIMRDATYAIDVSRQELHLPTRTIDEFDGYVWETKRSKGQTTTNYQERTVNLNEDGMKCLEYLIGYIDGVGREGTSGVRQTTRATG